MDVLPGVTKVPTLLPPGALPASTMYVAMRSMPTGGVHLSVTTLPFLVDASSVGAPGAALQSMRPEVFCCPLRIAHNPISTTATTTMTTAITPFLFIELGLDL